MKNKSHLTAIARNKCSKPMRWLEKEGLIGLAAHEPTLDYGCGRGFDADYYDMVKYDPYYFDLPLIFSTKYKVITCNYVLNTIPEEELRLQVIARIKELLEDGGVAYISIRADKKDLRGYTPKGTWQGYVADTLELAGLTRIKQTSTYEIWEWRVVS